MRLRPIPASEFSPLTVELPSLPYFGESPEPWKLDRCLWARTSVTVTDANVFGGMFVATQGDAFLIQEKETEPPLYAYNYSEFFKPESDGTFAFDDSHITARHTLESALLVSNRVSWNYFHWTFETLPKLLSDSGNAPAIIAHHMPEQHYQSLSLLSKRDILMIGYHDALNVRALTLPATHCYLPDDASQIGTAVVSREAATLVASRYADALGSEESEPTDILWVSRTAYARKTGTRDLVNAAEIEAMLVARGARVFHPHDASIIEQREAFASARIVVMPAGAAFANVVFCRPGTTILALAQATYTDLACFGDIAHGLGLRYATVYGPGIPATIQFPSHRNITICPDALSRALAWADGRGPIDAMVPATRSATAR